MDPAEFNRRAGIAERGSAAPVLHVESDVTAGNQAKRTVVWNDGCGQKTTRIVDIGTGVGMITCEEGGRVLA